MKFKASNNTIWLITLLIGAGLWFSSCSKDEQEVVPKTLEYYKTQLSEIVTSEKAIVANCVLGYNKGDFMYEEFYLEYTSDYMEALLAADSVLALPDVTIADIMDANYFISSPGNLFNASIYISDRRPIHERIVYCDTLRVHTPIGTDPGAAPQEAHDQFGAAITEAKGVRSRSTTIERQVTEAVNTLDMELGVFENAIIK